MKFDAETKIENKRKEGLGKNAEKEFVTNGSWIQKFLQKRINREKNKNTKKKKINLCTKNMLSSQIRQLVLSSKSIRALKFFFRILIGKFFMLKIL
jgi:hypothetical protein